LLDSDESSAAAKIDHLTGLKGKLKGALLVSGLLQVSWPAQIE
jgi:hypothetical protein